MRARELKALEWSDEGGGTLRLLDQTLLPRREVWLSVRSAEAAAQSIREMVVRGAPAIGIAAAYAMALAALEAQRSGASEATRRAQLDKSRALLASTRPTAVNLFWALEACARQIAADPSPAALLALARRLHAEDAAGNERIGELGLRHLEALPQPFGVLTHCNAGALATGGLGTALAPIFLAHERGLRFHVYVDETRPRLQGARLTAWELTQVGIPHTLLVDGAAASLMAKKKIHACLVGADRIAANGDTANKVGTYSVAVNAAHHGLPLLVAAPSSTFDLALPGGDSIPIEERAAAEVTDWGLDRTCPAKTPVHNPAFDVTPAPLIRAILTERGEISPVDAERVRAVVGQAP